MARWSLNWRRFQTGRRTRPVFSQNGEIFAERRTAQNGAEREAGRKASAAVDLCPFQSVGLCWFGGHGSTEPPAEEQHQHRAIAQHPKRAKRSVTLSDDSVSVFCVLAYGENKDKTKHANFGLSGLLTRFGIL